MKTTNRFTTIEHPALNGGKVRIKLPPGSNFWVPIRVEFPGGKTQEVFKTLAAAGLTVDSWKARKDGLPELKEKP